MLRTPEGCVACVNCKLTWSPGLRSDTSHPGLWCLTRVLAYALEIIGGRRSFGRKTWLDTIVRVMFDLLKVERQLKSIMQAAILS